MGWITDGNSKSDVLSMLKDVSMSCKKGVSKVGSSWLLKTASMASAGQPVINRDRSDEQLQRERARRRGVTVCCTLEHGTAGVTHWRRGIDSRVTPGCKRPRNWQDRAGLGCPVGSFSTRFHPGRAHPALTTNYVIRSLLFATSFSIQHSS